MARTILAGTATLVALTAPAPLQASPSAAPVSTEETAIRKVVADYGRAIETKDLTLFKAVKPNLTKDEEERLRKAFAGVESQVVEMTVQSVQVENRQATVRLSRRDTINKSIVAAFPQMLVLEKGPGGWAIREIGR